MKVKTNTGKVDLTAEMVCRGMVLQSKHWVTADTPDGVMVMDRPSDVMCGDEHGWTATNGAGVFPSTATLLGCDPTIASRADCERFGVHGNAAAHGFARLRNGGAVDLRRNDVPGMCIHVLGAGRATYPNGATLVPTDRFVGLDVRHARREDVERLCCGERPRRQPVVVPMT